MSSATAYGAVPYPSLPLAFAHPDRPAVVGRLHGLAVAAADGCRFLDLGCGDGGNLLSVAATWPGAECVGMDLDAGSIARARALASAAGLERVRLESADLRDPPADIGQFDYITVNGLLSWIQAPLRAELLQTVAGLLRPGGLACVSYAALPGYHLRAIAREVALRRAGAEAEPVRRLRVARETLALASELHGEDDLYGGALREEAARYDARDDRVLFHDELAPGTTPLTFDEVVGLAERHGLTYVGEALWHHVWPWRLSAIGAQRLRAAAGPDRVVRQQLADDAIGAPFKASVFGRELEPFAPEPSSAQAASLLARATAAITLSTRAATPADQVAQNLRQALPGELELGCLSANTGLDLPTVLSAVGRLAATGQAALHVQPFAAATAPGPRPRAGALARALAERGADTASLRHETVHFPDAISARLLGLLDGTRDRAQIAADLRRAGSELRVPAAALDAAVAGLDVHLQRLAQLGLLEQ